MITSHATALRTDEILQDRLYRLHARTDRLFALLFVIQWGAAVLLAALYTPFTWVGSQSGWHTHLYSAILLGGLLSVAPIAMAIFAPGTFATRLTVSLAQAGYSALLIHLSGGRIETHFHIFGSLAFLAFYRDWRVLVPATCVVGMDHILRGMFWPESVFGVLSASLLRAFEHVAWVLFEDIYLVYSCVTGRRDMYESAKGQAELEHAKRNIEAIVEKRTQELQCRTKELEDSIEESKRMSQRLAQAQKLESIGQLAAGVAHEINTPMQFIGDNSVFLQDCMERLLKIAASYAETTDPDGPMIPWQERRAMALEVLDECRHDELQMEVPAAIQENQDGIERVVEIVRAMKEFSHPGTQEKVECNLNKLITSTVTVSRNKWKYHAEMVLDLSDDLPLVKVQPAELNQVVLNLIVNAADAIREKFGDAEMRGRITIRSYVQDESVVLSVEDSGVGLPAELRSRVFDPFFTTKDVGKGTGQGLAISHNIIVNKHCGSIDIESVEGQGTTFIVRLPLNSEDCSGPAELALDYSDESEFADAFLPA